MEMLEDNKEKLVLDEENEVELKFLVMSVHIWNGFYGVRSLL